MNTRSYVVSSGSAAVYVDSIYKRMFGDDDEEEEEEEVTLLIDCR